jgi:hypothetical protein
MLTVMTDHECPLTNRSGKLPSLDGIFNLFNSINESNRKPRKLIAEYYLHWTTTFEISFAGSSDTDHDSLL